MGEGDLSLEEREEKLQLEEVCEGRGPARHRKESVLSFMDEEPLAGQPQPLEIFLEAISKAKNNVSGKTQWFVAGQSVRHQLVSPRDGRSGSMAVPHQGFDRCFDPQTTGTWLASKQRGLQESSHGGAT